MMSTVLDGLKNAGLMAYQVWWALVLGFAISAIVQAWVPRHRIESALSGSGFGPISKATGLGAASSSCSYAAIAIARSLFEKGASAATALAFQFASTNLVWELGLVLWVLIGWQFTLAEYVGGIVMIALMSVLLRRFVSPRLEERAREHAQRAAADHQHPAAGLEGMSLRERLTSASAWTRRRPQLPWRLGDAVEGDHRRVPPGGVHRPPRRRLLQLPLHRGRARGGEDDRERDRRPDHRRAQLRLLGGERSPRGRAVVGGISFAGVMAFIFADLIVLPIIVAYRKYYGTAFALRITVLMFVTMVVAALIVDGLFSVLGLIPETRPTQADIFGSIELDYKLVLNVIGLFVFVILFGLTMRRGPQEAPAHAH